MKAERTHFARALDENMTNANYFNLSTNSINSHLNYDTESHMQGIQLIARSDTANKDAIGITNLLFGIQQLGNARVRTKRFRLLTPSANWKQIIGPMINQNEIQTLEKNYEIQIKRTNNDMPPPNSGPLGQSPSGQGPTRPYAQRITVKLQTMIFPPTLNTEQEIPEIQNVMTKETIKDHLPKWMLKGFDHIPVGKNEEGQYRP
ncbi:MAG: hypothetical protein EZS28_020528 [Streblomastix strix]|uniref:Uncharacterized protein n=1 Tax=Streblomastix strix TaxID=222440 RepID=A0A5J4VNC0_9EUKA|nr:MAG: hypothetical protein EZS28_020528 [Streblomastix strix]